MGHALFARLTHFLLVIFFRAVRGPKLLQFKHTVSADPPDAHRLTKEEVRLAHHVQGPHDLIVQRLVAGGLVEGAGGDEMDVIIVV